jgi:cytochrome b involved in lipid metabolism
MGADKVFEEKDVSSHNTEADCWLILGEIGDRKVYDVTKFLDDHPGGPEIMVDVAGKDANSEFEDIGHSDDARAQLAEYLLGTLKVCVTASFS